MRHNYLRFLFIILLSLQAAVYKAAFAETRQFDFHANAKMMHRHHGPVDNAYGLINVIIDGQGNGRLEVMFYNGSHFNWVRFNAEVRFMDARGQVVDEAHIYRWMESAGMDGADERKVSKSLSISQVTSIEVDFYLTDLSNAGANEIARIDAARLVF